MNEISGEGIHQDVLLAIVASTLVILLLVTGITLAFYISGRQRIKQKIALAETKLAYEKELRTVEMEVAESVMTQFAQELHDNIGQLLTALHIQVENIKIDHPEIEASFKPAQSYISEISGQLRLLSRTLNNDYIGHIGLDAALQMEIDRLNSLKRFKVYFNGTSGPVNLEKNQELMVFRIFQEITNNAMKHAKADNLYVKVNNAGKGFSLQVKDDGKGFDKAAILSSDKSSGLRNISKRAALAGLALTIESVKGDGSLFIIEKKENLS